MQFHLDQQLNLKTGVTVTVVGEVDIVEDGRPSKLVVGRLPLPTFVPNTTALARYYLFPVSEVQQ
jgi:hypothetical protein